MDLVLAIVLLPLFTLGCTMLVFVTLPGRRSAPAAGVPLEDTPQTVWRPAPDGAAARS